MANFVLPCHRVWTRFVGRRLEIGANGNEAWLPSIEVPEAQCEPIIRTGPAIGVGKPASADPL